MITIEQIKELLAKATPGPWEVKNDSANGKDEAWCYWHSVGPFELIGKDADNNSLFIAALPEIAQLCLGQAEELERLREQRARCLDVCYKSDGMEICKNCGLE